MTQLIISALLPRYRYRLLTVAALATLSLAGCATQERHDQSTARQINQEMNQAISSQPRATPQSAVSAALLPPLTVEMPRAKKAPEERFNLTVNNASAQQVFLGIVSGTRYSMLVSPDITGALSINLKNVTVFEALDAIRELYGYDYRIDGNRIYVESLTARTRVFKINYINGQRKGTSDIRVTSGSVSDAPNTGTSSTGGPTTTTNSTTPVAFETSKITTTTESDFWSELRRSLVAIIGDKDGRTVVVSPQSGVVLIHALPLELRQVERYLQATQLSVDRQVMLEAKIIEVQLSDGYQSGINWGAFNRSGQNRFSVGADAATQSYPYGETAAGSSLGTVLGNTLPKAIGAASGLLNIAVQADNFAALISFLNTQGHVHVLSSPRIATMNNQMAVLKVGTDEFFVTNVSSTTVTGTTTTSTPNVTLRPFFSGIALDVMPQISDDGQITLHVHPSVSQVSEKDKTVDLGGNLGKLHLPLASSTVSETDSVVRVQDGTIVAIGGLMQQSMSDDRSGVPVAGDVPVFGALFRQTNRASQKRELVILLKTTVVKGNSEWAQDVLESRQRIRQLQGDTSEDQGSATRTVTGRP